MVLSDKRDSQANRFCFVGVVFETAPAGVSQFKTIPSGTSFGRR